MINELVQAFELANIEALVVSLPDSHVVAATSAILRRWNTSREAVVGKPLKKFGTGTLSARHLPPDDENPGVTSVEVVYAPPLGNTVKTPFRTQQWTADGNFYLLIGQHASVEQAEALANDEKRLNLALKSGGYALWDYNFETDETYNSPEMLDVFGHAVGDVPLNFHTFNSLLHPEDRDKTLEQKIRDAPFGTDTFQTRYRARTKAGKYAWIESIAGVLRDPVNGRPMKAVGLCRNIDAQMVALDRLKASEKNLKRTQEAAQIGSFSLRVESGVSRLTAELAQLMGMADAMVHPTLNTLISMIEPGDRDKFCEALELAKLGKLIKNLEIAVKLPSGDITYFDVSMEPEVDEGGTIESIFGCCQSVTERKALERKFHQAQKMEAVGQLTGGIAHDFNNLLMVVMGNLQLVEQLVASDARATKRIRAAMDAAERGSDLTRRMLAFSRQQTLQNKELTVSELVSSMHDMLSQALTATVALELKPAADIWPVKADKTMLETAILNLAINARDAMQPKGGTLTIETRNTTLTAEDCEDLEDVQPGAYVEIAVTDTGTGIAPENLEKVFQPFFTTKGPEAGSGLGLSMIYGFVKQSGGHVKLISELGKGTTVIMRLPRLKATQRPAAAPPAAVGADALQEHLQTALAAGAPASSEAGVVPAPAPPEAKPKILVVEDNDAVRDVAAAMIEEMGYEVLTASCGPEGLKTIEDNADIDLVLSDVVMAGGMNGPELAQKAMKVRPGLKVLFMSGYAPGSVRLMENLPDTIELVNKPFTRSDLTEKVQRALAA